MDAYLISDETLKSLSLGKPIRTCEGGGEGRVEYYHLGPANGPLNHERSLANKVLWKFLAEHAHQELRLVFSGDFEDSLAETLSACMSINTKW